MRLKALALFILLSQLSCSNSKITSSWKAGNINPGKYNKVLVLGLIRETDRTIREKMEEHLIGDLQRAGDILRFPRWLYLGQLLSQG